jgi:hypothetical protein
MNARKILVSSCLILSAPSVVVIFRVKSHTNISWPFFPVEFTCQVSSILVHGTHHEATRRNPRMSKNRTRVKTWMVLTRYLRNSPRAIEYGFVLTHRLNHTGKDSPSGELTIIYN